ncbi:signal peptidase II [Patescibacteria group bacterium]
MRTMHWLLTYVGIFIFFALDRILKLVASRLEDNVELISETFVFAFEKNREISWNIPLSSWPLYLLIGIIIVILIILLGKAYRQKNFVLVTGILLILVGALSNILDRIWYGAVIDYLKVLAWPTSNLADVMIFIGVVIIAFGVIRSQEKKPL